MKTFAIFLLSKETFTTRTCSILEIFFRKLLSKATFERELSSVSLLLDAYGGGYGYEHGYTSLCTVLIGGLLPVVQ